jgi:uncharacterized protein involved in cysteine biosynthesis
MDDNKLIFWLNIANLIIMLAIIFVPVYISIHQNNYWWLFMWAFLFVIQFSDYTKNKHK